MPTNPEFVVAVQTAGLPNLPVAEQGETLLSRLRELVEFTRRSDPPWCGPERPRVVALGSDMLFVFASRDHFVAGASPGEWCLGLAEQILRAHPASPRNAAPGSGPTRSRPSIAVHKSEFFRWVEFDEEEFLVGPGFDQVLAILRAADPGQVLVSKEFRDFLAEEQYGQSFVDKDFPRFAPSDLGVELGGHGRRGPVLYWYRGPRDVVDEGVPSLVRKLREVDRRIYATLKSLFDHISAELAGQENLRPRLSIFLPHGDGDRLRVTRFRYRADYSPEQIPPSRTSYRIFPKELAQGPVGLAFVKCRPIILVGLPEETRPVEEWIRAILERRALSGELMNLDEGELKAPGRWVRKAQSFIAVPICSPQDAGGESPIGALCVDMRNPLTGVEAKRLEVMSAELADLCGQRLWPLLQLRMAL
ncbi:MAG: hypothetical protein HYZ53_02930 [Planctomycetes bacterium]|nr:hypothetical protein [Planctomycetota bacterium]